MAWIAGAGGLINDEVPIISASEYNYTAPTMYWRVDDTEEINNGYIYNPLFPWITDAPTPPEPEPEIWTVPPRPLIHIYGSADTSFEGNGYAILEPISCTVRQEENGEYTATILFYPDKYEKHTYLKKGAQAKVPIYYHGELTSQVFRIKSVNRTMTADGFYRINVFAVHKFYDLSRFMLEDCRPTNLQGRAAIDWIFSHGWYTTLGDTQNHGFTWASDIVDSSTAYYQNVSVTGALLGADNAFINRWGGKLYRDNYYFSIKKEMENSRTSGVIQYSYNMTEIEWEEDDLDVITVLNAKDNFGNTYTVKNEQIPNKTIPYHIYGYAYFSYDEENVAAFERDAQAYFDEHKQSSVNIRVRFVDLFDLEKYKEFLALDTYEVGDRVTIYHKDLDIYYSNLEIISKEYDVVNRQTIEMELGNFKNAITRKPYMADTASSGNSAIDKAMDAIQKQQYDTDTNIMAASIAGMELFTIDYISERQISQISR